MVVPVLRREDGGHREADHGGGDRHGRGVAPRCDGEQISQGEHAQTDPDAESIERSRIYVVAFARLRRARIEVYHQRDAHHYEHPHHHREIALVAVELVYQTYYSQQERQEKVGVAGGVVPHLVGQVGLRTHVQFVERLDAREPVAVGYGLLRSLYVVLASHEIPEEITPVHVVELVGEEVVEVFGEGRLGEVLARGFVVNRTSEIEHLARQGAALLVAQHLAVFVAHDVGLGAVCGPWLVLGFAFVGVPQTREEVHELRRVDIARKGGDAFVTPRVLVEVIRRALLGRVDGRRVVGAVQQRTVAVLVAVEHRQQRVRVVGIVAVHRRIGRGADRHRRVRRESDQNHRGA